MDLLELDLDLEDKIIIFRKRFDITQGTMAQMLDISRASLSNYENMRHNIPFWVKEKIQDIFTQYEFEITYKELYEEEKVLLYRIRNGLKQQDIARLLGYNSKYYSLIESGNAPITTQFVNRFKSDILSWRENDCPVQFVV